MNKTLKLLFVNLCACVMCFCSLGLGGCSLFDKPQDPPNTEGEPTEPENTEPEKPVIPATPQENFEWEYSINFVNLKKLTNITLEEVVIPTEIITDGKTYPVKEICESAFLGNTTIKKVTIPDVITKIPSHMFYECKNLETVVMPDSIKRVEYRAFMGCEKLVITTFPNNIYKIENYAFSNCDGLVNITLPQALTEIEECAFSNCDNLTTITLDREIPPVCQERNYMFGGCDKLTAIYVPNTSLWDYQYGAGWSSYYSKYKKLSTRPDNL